MPAGESLPSPQPAKFARRTYTAGRDDHRPSRGGERDCPHPRPRPHPQRGPRLRRWGNQGRTRPPVGRSHLLHLAPRTAGPGSPPPTPPRPGEARSPQPAGGGGGTCRHQLSSGLGEGRVRGRPGQPLTWEEFAGRDAGLRAGAQVSGSGRAEGAAANSPSRARRAPGWVGGKEGGSEGREGSRAAPKRGRKGPRRRGGARRSMGWGGRARRRPAPGAQVHGAAASPPVGPRIPGLAAPRRLASWRLRLRAGTAPHALHPAPHLRLSLLPPLFLLSTRQILRGKVSNAAGRGGKCNQLGMIQGLTSQDGKTLARPSASSPTPVQMY